MKKICFVTTIYMTYKCFLKDLSKFLYESGEYDISLICNNEDGLLDDLPSFVHYFPIEMKRGVSLSAFGAIRNIEKILKEEDFDLVQYSTPNAAFYTSIAAKKAKVPVRLYCQWGIRYMGFEGWKRNLFKFLEKKTCDNSTFIEVESHNIRNFSIEEGLYLNNKSSVIWNGSASGVDLTKFDISKKELWRQEIRKQYGLEENDIVFVISDDGAGIPPEKLDSLLDERTQAAVGSSSRHVGVSNTNLRLKSLYGSGYGLSFTSVPGQGTEVTVRIPAQEEEEF